jgi:hypothetical protein
MVQRVWTSAVAALLLTGAAGCAPDRNPSDGEEVAPEVRFETLQFQVYRGAALEASGTAAAARMRRDTSALSADGIRVDFPARGERAPARMTATRGEGNASDRWLQLEGGILIRQAGDEVATERARYDADPGLVRGDAPVVVTGEAYRLEGPGFTLDPEARRVRVDGGADLRTGGASR